jgi:Pectate lyase superfamily protein
MPATTITATVRNALGLVSRPLLVLALIAETGMGLDVLLARRVGRSYCSDAAGSTRRVKNVKDFGAKGDGVRDDAAAIQAAVNAVFAPPPRVTTATTWFSGVVFFPPGAYVLKSPITVLNQADEFNVHFLGVGQASRLLNQTNGHSINLRRSSSMRSQLAIR